MNVHLVCGLFPLQFVLGASFISPIRIIIDANLDAVNQNQTVASQFTLITVVIMLFPRVVYINDIENT